ncbi:prion-like-(Q/N-rich) domain-bearing protein 25 [Pararge aegeria]|uniref:prion-like-(Q/N-rich) domain-bearing protein 25 n=1 Tax=Pararge aegeria TaxID=116150 RepID=UPI0019D0B1CD|nr:prion-like-(Q/N-rich) domain-bearing protein 25 [Pararge aegeria]XP_039765672.1 prion-like-(Q/N-rich) domain-bearing protein 25 [Pararge aegeria]
MASWWLCATALILAAGSVAAQGPEKRRTGNVCNVDIDCPDNAFCRQSSYCVCKDGFVYAAINSTHKGCLKEARNGEECVQHIQCHSTMSVHSECNNGVCACASTAHLETDRCYETAVIGGRCVVDQNCFLGETGAERQAFCVRGYCTCQLQYSPRDNGTRCVRDAALGEECEDELQCAGLGLQCRGTCRCKDNWVAFQDINACVESAKALDDPCQYDVQCDALAGTAEAPSPGASLCLGGVCTCAYDARAVGTPPRCWRRKRPGQDCNRDEECVSEEDEPGYCLSGRCTCKTCSPDARDFGAASSLSPPLAATILSLAAIFAR